MDWLEKHLKVSLNMRLINKDERNDKLAHREGWQNWELPPDLLAQAIGRGVAYSVQVIGGIRKTQHFLASDTASVDVDGSRTVDDALEDPFCKEHLTILYLTKSHTVEEPRFRLLFALPRTITDPLEQRALNRALALRLTGDTSATDAVRIYYGSDLAEPSVFNGGISAEVLDDLIRQGRSLPRPDRSSGYGGNASARGNGSLTPDTMIKTAGGATVCLGDIGCKTSIYCPFHRDQRASAFVGFNERESQFLHCSRCQTTWWCSESKEADYDFTTFDQAVESFVGDPFRHPLGQPLLGEQITPPIRGKQSIKQPKLTVTRTADDFFMQESIRTGITFVKSPKGSGKTTTLPGAMAPLTRKWTSLETFETDYDDEGPPQSMDTDYRVLLIGHRRALIRDLCQRFGLNCYLDDGKHNDQQIALRKKRYGICVDSLWKVRTYSYDLIIIDESEQVLRHFLSETLERGRAALFTIFHQLLASARSIVAMDADLDWTSYLTICRLGNSSLTVLKPPGKAVFVYYNEPHRKSRELFMFRSSNHLLADFLHQVRQGRRIFFTSNSKAKIDGIAELLDAMEPKPQYLKITADNSNTRDIQDFILNIRTKVLDYQIVLTSPSLGTGVDITLPEQGEQVDIVYGHFENLINTHFDIDQQLRRVRRPAEVRVWISPRTFNFETDVQTVESDLIEAAKEIGSGWDNNLLRLAALVTSVERASKNHLRRNFISYKEAQGWTVTIVDVDDDLVSKGKDAWDMARRFREDHYVERLMSATPIVQADYLSIEERIDDNDEVSEFEMLSFQRAGIESFYRTPISKDLIKLDDHGRFRSRVRNFEWLYKRLTESPWNSKLAVTEEELRRPLQLLPNRKVIPWLLHTLLSATPAYRDHEFALEARYNSTDLEDFVVAVRKYRMEIMNLLEMNIPKDLAKKPVAFLGTILWRAGVRHEEVERKKRQGNVIYTYALQADSLEALRTIAARREAEHEPWRFLHDLHNLSGALYGWFQHKISDSPSGGTYVTYLAPYTPGKAITLRRTQRLARKFGFVPNADIFHAGNQRLRERFRAMAEARSQEQAEQQETTDLL